MSSDFSFNGFTFSFDELKEKNIVYRIEGDYNSANMLPPENQYYLKATYDETSGEVTSVTVDETKNLTPFNNIRFKTKYLWDNGFTDSRFLIESSRPLNNNCAYWAQRRVGMFTRNNGNAWDSNNLALSFFNNVYNDETLKNYMTSYYFFNPNWVKGFPESFGSAIFADGKTIQKYIDDGGTVTLNEYGNGKLSIGSKNNKNPDNDYETKIFFVGGYTKKVEDVKFAFDSELCCPNHEIECDENGIPLEYISKNISGFSIFRDVNNSYRYYDNDYNKETVANSFNGLGINIVRINNDLYLTYFYTYNFNGNLQEEVYYKLPKNNYSLKDVIRLTCVKFPRKDAINDDDGVNIYPTIRNGYVIYIDNVLLSPTFINYRKENELVGNKYQVVKKCLVPDSNDMLFEVYNTAYNNTVFNLCSYSLGDINQRYSLYYVRFYDLTPPINVKMKIVNKNDLTKKETWYSGTYHCYYFTDEPITIKAIGGFWTNEHFGAFDESDDQYTNNYYKLSSVRSYKWDDGTESDTITVSPTETTTYKCTYKWYEQEVTKSIVINIIQDRIGFTANRTWVNYGGRVKLTLVDVDNSEIRSYTLYKNNIVVDSWTSPSGKGNYGSTTFIQTADEDVCIFSIAIVNKYGRTKRAYAIVRTKYDYISDLFLRLCPKFGATKSLEYKTQVLTSYTHTEDRLAQRESPRMYFKYNYLTGIRDSYYGFLDNVRDLGLATKVYIPDWVCALRVSDTDNIILPSTHEFFSGDKVLVYKDFYTYELVDCTITGEKMSLNVEDIYTDCLIVPIYVCYLDKAPKFSSNDFEHEVEASFVTATPNYKKFTVFDKKYLGHDLLLDFKTTKTQIDREVTQDVIKTDYDIGLKNVYTLNDRTFESFDITIACNNSELHDVLNFVKRRYGKKNSFFLSLGDSAFVKDGYNKDDFITDTIDINPTNHNFSDRPHICIRLRNGDYVCAKVTNVNNTKTTITINTTLNVKAIDIIGIDTLLFVRLDSDKIDIKLEKYDLYKIKLDCIETKFYELSSDLQDKDVRSDSYDI